MTVANHASKGINYYLRHLFRDKNDTTTGGDFKTALIANIMEKYSVTERLTRYSKYMKRKQQQYDQQLFVH